jgi:putative PIN family toxin of toxin-antitoxin system
VLSATADTNIYISAFNFGGLPRRFLELAATGDFRLDISDAILHETQRVLRHKFQWTADKLRDVEEDIRSYAHWVIPSLTLDVVRADPSDNRILECAVEAASDYIVTGDTRHLLPLKRHGKSEIATVAEFLERIQPED